MKMRLNEELYYIKSKMGLNEGSKDDTEEFVKNYERKYNMIIKVLPSLEKLLKDNFGEDLYKMSTTIKKVSMGSTIINNYATGERYPYVAKRVEITLEFINKGYSERLDIKNQTRNLINDFLSVDIYLYGSPIDVEYINYIPTTKF